MTRGKCTKVSKHLGAWSLEARVAYNVPRGEPKECWEWRGGKDPCGYGWLVENGKRLRGHRLVWEATHGPIPQGQLVLHRCDNRPCCNPDHLFLGTQQENIADMNQKGRRKGNPRKGERSNLSRLTAPQVLAIRSDPRKLAEIAADYGVGFGQISSIKLRKCWRHI